MNRLGVKNHMYGTDKKNPSSIIDGLIKLPILF